jgi:protein-arginine kinase activator protein McsA
MLAKIKTIILSRINKTKTEPWVEDRRHVCSLCPHNSKNVNSISSHKKILMYLSDFYSWITGNSEVDTLGNCLFCESCSIYYKTKTYVEDCGDGRWKSIYTPNSAQEEKWKNK